MNVFYKLQTQSGCVLVKHFGQEFLYKKGRMCRYLSFSVFAWMYFACHQLSGMCCWSRKDSLLLVHANPVLPQSCKCQIFFYTEKAVKSTKQISSARGHFNTRINPQDLWHFATLLRRLVTCWQASVKYDGRSVMFCMKWWSASHSLTCSLLVLGRAGHSTVKPLAGPTPVHKLWQLALFQHLFNIWTFAGLVGAHHANKPRC